MLYIFIIAVLNLAVGFAVAGHLGRRYRAIMGEDEFFATPAASDSPPAETDVTETDPTETPDEEAFSFPEEDQSQAEETEDVEASSEDLPVEEAESSEDAVAQPETPVEQPERPDTQPMSFDGDMPDCLEPTDADELEESLASLTEATEDFLDNRGAKFRASEKADKTPPADDPLVDDSPVKEPVPAADESSE